MRARISLIVGAAAVLGIGAWLFRLGFPAREEEPVQWPPGVHVASFPLEDARSFRRRRAWVTVYGWSLDERTFIYEIGDGDGLTLQGAVFMVDRESGAAREAKYDWYDDGGDNASM